MKAPKTIAEESSVPTQRRPGRRPRSNVAGADLSRDAVIRCAVELAQKESIAEVSMVRVARELGVAPGLIHYYVGSRDDLLSAVLNAASRDRVTALPPLTGNWQKDLEGVCRSTLETFRHWPGVAHYISTQNRFRLFQRAQPGETDYGLTYFDHLGRIFKHGGFTPTQAALAYDQTMMFVTSLSIEYANRLAPGEHEDFIVGYVSRFDRKDIPGASFMVGPFAKIDSEKRLSTGLKLLIGGFETWLSDRSADPRVGRAPRQK